MRDRLWSYFAIPLFLIPVTVAFFQADGAKTDAFFHKRAAYNNHHRAPEMVMATYDVLGFRPAEIRAGIREVPRRFLITLPSDMATIPSAVERKRLFIATMLPLILRSNEFIAQDRARLLSLRDKIARGDGTNGLERRWLLELARQYGLKAAENAADLDFPELARRVDRVPASLALAQAAIESGWGTSRFAREGNAIYGQWTWSKADSGIVPLRRGADQTHRIRAFNYLIDSVRGYMVNLNRNSAYVSFRNKRSRLQAEGQPGGGRALAETMIQYSTRREAYVADLKAIIRINQLEEFDRAALVPLGFASAR